MISFWASSWAYWLAFFSLLYSSKENDLPD
uniref:Uncharacterized protein n=1 Tax=Siphoviridae sp. ctm7X10 TaxID=2827929 RepID=A0A8S5S5A1_9CAUD|nr:MAG TPA: hypothetical protein [Siphoviridae sp. ctm7X10]